MPGKRFVVLLSLILPFAAFAQSEAQLVRKYESLAGSEENARTLVQGLRDGTSFELGSTRFEPPTGKMGYGNVDHALSLAQRSLAEKGIENPTPAQLEQALIGTSASPGILALRAEGRGWGQIANAMGIRLGDVKRSASAPERAAAGAGRPERPERPARMEKPERPVKPDRPFRPERPVKPERPIR